MATATHRVSLSIPDLSRTPRRSPASIGCSAPRASVSSRCSTAAPSACAAKRSRRTISTRSASVRRVGRLLGADDNRPDAPRVVVLSHRTWVARFGAAATSSAARSRHRARSTPSPASRRPGSAARSRTTSSSSGCRCRSTSRRTCCRIDPRARPGRSDACARARRSRRAGRSRRARPAARARLPWRRRDGCALRIEPMGENWRAGFRSSAWLLLGASVLLLTVAATNVAGLMVARVIDRRRELAVSVRARREPWRAGAAAARRDACCWSPPAESSARWPRRSCSTASCASRRSTLPALPARRTGSDGAADRARSARRDWRLRRARAGAGRQPRAAGGRAARRRTRSGRRPHASGAGARG